MNATTTGILPWEHRVSVIIVYDVICIFGVFSCGLPILLTFCTNLRKVHVHFMIANMSSADFLNCFVILIQNVYILHRNILPEAGCTVLGFFQFMMDVQVFVFPPFLSINRYVALFHSHLYDRLFSRRRIYSIIFMTWLICALIPAVFTLGGQMKFDEANEHCCVVTNGHLEWSIVYWMVILVPLVGVSDGTVVYCNYKIFKLLRDHAAVENLNVNVVRQNREMLVYLFIEMLLPVSAHTVYHVVKFAYFEREIVFFRVFFAGLVFFNSVMRGVFTLVLLAPYKRECKKLLSLVWLKCAGKWRGGSLSWIALKKIRRQKTSSNTALFGASSDSSNTAKTEGAAEPLRNEPNLEVGHDVVDAASGVYLGDITMYKTVQVYGTTDVEL